MVLAAASPSVVLGFVLGLVALAVTLVPIRPQRLARSLAVVCWIVAAELLLISYVPKDVRLAVCAIAGATGVVIAASLFMGQPVLLHVRRRQPDPDVLADKYTDWLRRICSDLPDRPRTGLTSTALLYDRTARASSDAQDAVSMKQFERNYNEVERRTRGEYQKHFRDDVVAVVSDAHAEAVSEPRTIRQFESIRLLLNNRRSGAGEEARAKQEGFLRAGEKLRERLGVFESEALFWPLVADVEQWRYSAERWAKTQHGQPGSYGLIALFGEKFDIRPSPSTTRHQSLVLFIDQKLHALRMYDPEEGR